MFKYWTCEKLLQDYPMFERLLLKLLVAPTKSFTVVIYLNCILYHGISCRVGRRLSSKERMKTLNWKRKQRSIMMNFDKKRREEMKWEERRTEVVECSYLLHSFQIRQIFSPRLVRFYLTLMFWSLLIFYVALHARNQQVNHLEEVEDANAIPKGMTYKEWYKRSYSAGAYADEVRQTH